MLRIISYNYSCGKITMVCSREKMHLLVLRKSKDYHKKKITITTKSQASKSIKL